MVSDLDPAAVMAEHEPEPSITDAKGNRHGWWCSRCNEWSSEAEKFCPPYRLAEALAVSEAKVARLTSALERTEGNFRNAVNGRPVRDMAENLAENARALTDPQG